MFVQFNASSIKTHTGSNTAITEGIRICCRTVKKEDIRQKKMSPPLGEIVWFLTIFLAYPDYILPAIVPAILEERQKSVNIYCKWMKSMGSVPANSAPTQWNLWGDRRISVEL